MLCDPLDHVALSDALITLLTDDDARTRLRDAGAVRWRLFDWQVTADAMVDLYGRVVRGDVDDLR
jgi:glycosyltransferase involved in cell wall biosynthesis